MFAISELSEFTTKGEPIVKSIDWPVSIWTYIDLSNIGSPVDFQ